jgi:asparagine synthase (glutamine-hydrolysing)
MCGICGLAGWVESGTLDRMCDVMTHRGPDDRGAYTDLGGPVGLAMRRLSIRAYPKNQNAI